MSITNTVIKRLTTGIGAFAVLGFALCAFLVVSGTPTAGEANYIYGTGTHADTGGTTTTTTTTGTTTGTTGWTGGVTGGTNGSTGGTPGSVSLQKPNAPPQPAMAEKGHPADFEPGKGADKCNCGVSAISAAAPDPVDLTTGEENFTAPPDLAVYNPNGPSAIFQRTWHHYQGFGGYQTAGFTNGWISNYDVTLQGVKTDPLGTVTTNQTLGIIYPNGGSEAIMGAGAYLDTPGSLSVSPRAMYTAAFGSNSDTVNITWKDSGVVWTFTEPTQSNRHTFFFRLTRITDRMGHYINIVWNNGGAYGSSSDFLTKVTDSSGAALFTVSYQTTGGVQYLASVADRYGRQVVFTTSTIAAGFVRLTGVSQVVPTGTSSPPNHYTYSYQLYTYTIGGTSTQLYFLSATTMPSPTGTGAQTAHINYSASAQVLNNVDANGNKVSFQYFGNASLVTTSDAGNHVVDFYTQYYNNQLHNTGVMDAAGHRLQIDYARDPSWAPVNVTYPDGLTESFTYDDHGRPITHTDTLGITTTYTWAYSTSPNGRLTHIHVPGLFEVSATYYEPSGLLQVATVTDSVGTALGSYSYTYDSYGNQLTSTVPGNTTSSTMTTTLTYSGLGQPSSVTDNLGHTVATFGYDAVGRLAASIDALGNETDTAYNLADQVTTVTAPATGNTGTGHATTVYGYQYTGGPLQSVTAFDESGTQIRQAQYHYGPEAELTSVTGIADAAAYTYDGAYRIKSVTDGNGNATTYNYDNDGRLASVISPLGDSVQYVSYDAAGRLLTKIDGNGATTNYAYGAVDHQLTSVTYPSTPSMNVALTYDSFGRVILRTDGSGQETYGYDSRSLLASVVTTYTGQSAQSINYTYNPDGSRKTMDVGSNHYAYTYDGVGRFIQMTSPAGTSTASYFNNGAEAGRALPNGVSTTYSYNPVGMLTALTNNTSGGGILSQFGSFTYDGVFNMTGVSSSVSGYATGTGTTTYSYDNVTDRLLQEVSGRAGGYTNNFGYDGAGNPTTMRGNTQTFNINNQLGGGSTWTGGGGGPAPVDPTGISATIVSYSGTAEQVQFAPVVPAGTGTQDYDWQISTDGGVTWPTPPTRSATFMASITTGTVRARVRASTSAGVGNWVTGTDTTYCAPPVDPKYVSLTYSFASPNWTTTYTAVAPAGGFPAQTYNWQYSTNSGTSWTDLGWSSSTTYSRTFASGNMMTRVRVQNSAGYISNWITSTDQNFPGGNAPVAPTSITLTANYTGSIEYLQAYANVPAGTGSQLYEWNISLNGAAFDTSNPYSGQPAQFGFTAGTVQFRVRSTTAAGSSAWVSSSVQPYVAPGAILNPSTISSTYSASGGGYTVTFTAVYSGGVPASNVLHCQLSINSGGTWFEAASYGQVQSYNIPLSGQVRARFRAENPSSGTVGAWVSSGDVPGLGPMLALSLPPSKTLDKPLAEPKSSPASATPSASTATPARAPTPQHPNALTPTTRSAATISADLYRQAGLFGNTAGRPKSDPFDGLLASTDGLPSLQSAAYVYDGNGNPTTYNNTAITYDQENRITSIGTVMTAGYRADNLRAWKQTAAGRTYYYYDGSVPVLETDSTGAVTAQNVFAPDGLVARYQGGWIYYTFDQQGNVTERLDASGTVLSASTFDSYGMESTSGSPSDPFGYNAACGYMEDRETGLYYCQNRYFDPNTGRWINRDPIGFDGGMNQYEYAQGGPLNAADATGLMTDLGIGHVFQGIINDINQIGAAAEAQAASAGRVAVGAAARANLVLFLVTLPSNGNMAADGDMMFRSDLKRVCITPYNGKGGREKGRYDDPLFDLIKNMTDDEVRRLYQASDSATKLKIKQMLKFLGRANILRRKGQ